MPITHKPSKTNIPHVQPSQPLQTISSKKTILVLGATSEIAVATLKEMAQEGWDFHLAGRDIQALANLASELKQNFGAHATFSHFDTGMSIEEQQRFWIDVLQITAKSPIAMSQVMHQATRLSTSTQIEIKPIKPQPQPDSNSIAANKDIAYDADIKANTEITKDREDRADTEGKEGKKGKAGDFDNEPTSMLNSSSALFDLNALLSLNSSLAGVFCAIGYLGKPHQAEYDLQEGLRIMQANFGGLIPILSLAANYFEKKREGLLVVVSSVAGERGRASNYPYGSAKAGMTAYLSGLRARLSRSNVHVMTVLPGFVKTRMIADRKQTPRPCATVEEVAQDIMHGIRKRKSVVYSKWYWRYIMFGVKHLPEWIFKKITL